MSLQPVPVALWVALLAAGIVSPAAPQSLLLRQVTLIDGSGSSPAPEMDVLLAEGRIQKIGRGLPDAADRILELHGKYLLPGLIDAHSHLSTVQGALRALESGVTTTRVLGEPFGQGLGLRDLIREGQVEGPELLVSGGIVRPVLGEGFLVFLPQFGQFLNQPLRGTDQVTAVVRALIDRGVDVIKLGATERAGLAETDPRKPELTLAEMASAVREAAGRGLRVAAHAHGAEGAAAAVAAGVFSIEHGTHLSDQTLLEMQLRGTWLVPTLAVMSPRADPPGDAAPAIALRNRFQHMYPALISVVKKAHRMGIPIAASTDGSYGDGEETARIRIAHDIEDLVACGFSPMEALVAATSAGARLLGIEHRTGTIREGFEADLLIVDRNPLEEPQVLLSPVVVVNNGRVVVEMLYGQ